MASFSAATRELVLKLVYYGPGLGGKTTSLKALHAAVRPEHRGRMISLATPVDRTLYFDFLPLRLPSIGDVQLRLQLFTVPGQVYFNATRKLVLTGADGVIFVADSQRARSEANTEALDNLRDNLRELNRNFDELPLVFSYNKRDLDDVFDMAQLDQALNPRKVPSFATSATRGEGVFEPLDAVVREALADLVRRKTLPPDVLLPQDRTVAERLASVQAEVPSRSVEPAQVVAGAAPRTPPPVPIPSEIEAALSQATETVERLVSPGQRAHEPRNTVTMPALQVGPTSDRNRRSLTLSSLFDTDEQEAVRTIEDALDEGLHPRALLLLEALLVRVLDRSARMVGRTEGHHEATAWMLGISPERYARTRTAAQRARRGTAATRREALEAYVLACSAQIAVAAMSERG
ncbi:MAG: GTPase domain-containing protein [Deltaproteobacteria bacterium]|nr:GTPase domain-containing protein [Deltaproteobacteria bacterium]